MLLERSPWSSMSVMSKLAPLALALSATVSFATPDQERVAERGQRGYFISIDGLNPSLLNTLEDAGKLDARRGLGWLMNQGIYAPKTWSVVTTLTAASHIGTVTCTPPSRHGITANTMLRNGEKVSGYTYDFATEPLWRSASRQGKKTLALAYVGADGRTPERSADFGLAYPDDGLLGPSQTLRWDPTTLATAEGWTLPAALSGRTDLKQATIVLKLNPKTNEERTVQVLVDLARTDEPELHFDADKNLTNGSFGKARFGETHAVDLFFVEESDASTLKGYKRRAFARLLPKTNGNLEVYVSKTSFNNAYPASFRKMLDDANFVWPDYGVRSDKLSVADNLEAQAMIDRFLTDVAVRFVPVLGADVVLFYQPLIDSIGHKYQSALPLPFDPNATDDVTKAFVRAFEIIDDNMSRLLERTGRNDVVALMGDHGMDPTIKVVNIAPLLPRDHIGRIEVVTSGSLAMIYAPVTDGSDAAIAAADSVGQSLRDALAGVQFEGKPVLGEALRKADPAPRHGRRFSDEWQHGEALWAFTAGTGFYVQYNPLSDQVFVDASALGMHGQAIELTPTMATALMIKGPRVSRRLLPEASLIDAVPTFSQLMGIDAPRDCLGRSLVTRRR